MDRGDVVPDGSAPPPVPPAVRDLPPGGPEARDRGCCCSVLANAGHRVDATLEALVDPGCPVHVDSRHETDPG